MIRATFVLELKFRTCSAYLSEIFHISGLSHHKKRCRRYNGTLTPIMANAMISQLTASRPVAAGTCFDSILFFGTLGQTEFGYLHSESYTKKNSQYSR